MGQPICIAKVSWLANQKRKQECRPHKAQRTGTGRDRVQLRLYNCLSTSDSDSDSRISGSHSCLSLVATSSHIVTVNQNEQHFNWPPGSRDQLDGKIEMKRNNQTGSRTSGKQQGQINGGSGTSRAAASGVSKSKPSIPQDVIITFVGDPQPHSVGLLNKPPNDDQLPLVSDLQKIANSQQSNSNTSNNSGSSNVNNPTLGNEKKAPLKKVKLQSTGSSNGNGKSSNGSSGSDEDKLSPQLSNGTQRRSIGSEKLTLNGSDKFNGNGMPQRRGSVSSGKPAPAPPNSVYEPFHLNGNGNGAGSKSGSPNDSPNLSRTASPIPYSDYLIRDPTLLQRAAMTSTLR